MPNHILHVNTSSGTSGQPTTAASTQFARIGDSFASFNTTESTRRVVVRTAGTLSDLQVNITPNTANGISSVTIRKNSTTDTAVTVSIGSAATGFFSDQTNTAAVAAGDAVSYKFVTGGTTGTFSVTFTACAFEEIASDEAVKILNQTIPAINNASVTHFYPVAGTSGTAITAEDTQQVTMRVPGGVTAKNAFVNVATNLRTTTTTYRLRKQTPPAAAVNGNLAVSVGNVATGDFEDTTNSDTLADGDRICLSVSTGTGTQTLTPHTFKIELEQKVSTPTTTIPQNQIIGSLFNGTPITQNVTNFSAVGGAVYNFTANTNVLVRTIEPATSIFNLAAYISANAIAGSSTFTLQRNGTDTTHTLSIGSSATGHFVSAAASVVTTAATDSINYKMVGATTSGTVTMTIRNVSVVYSTGVAAPAIPNINFQISSIAGNTPMASVAGATRFHQIGHTWLENGLSTAATEAQRNIKVQTAGNFSDMHVKLSANAATGASTFTLRRNAADTTLAVSAAASTSGDFTETTQTISIAAGDLLNYRSVSGGTGTFSAMFIQTAFSNTANTSAATAIMVEVSPVNLSTASATTHVTPVGQGPTGSSIGEHLAMLAIRTGATARRLNVYTSANARTSSTTFRTRKNGENGNQSVTVPASTSGLFEDNVNTDTLTLGDFYNYQYVTGSSTTHLTLPVIKTEVDGTD